MMKITANKWYGPTGLYSGRGPFRSPQSFLKESVGQEDYKWISKGPDPTAVRAAAVFPIEVEQWAHLLDTPWGMNVRFRRVQGKYIYNFRMIIVSVDDRYGWLERAINAGATAWWLGTASNHVWTWSPPDLDENSIEIRPTGTYIHTDTKTILRNQVKDYNVDQVISDARDSSMTYQEIGAKHGISRITVMKLAGRAGIFRNGAAHGKT